MVLSHYFINDDNLKSERKLIKFRIFNQDFKMYTDNGVFSKDGFDLGTRILLENIEVLNLKGRILDLGCGYGVVGIILKSINPQLVVDMCDINDRALALSRDNLKINVVNNRVFVSDIYSNVVNRYDVIVTNPPIRAGKNVVRNFLVGSVDHLIDEGILYFVMRKDHGAKSMVRELEEYFIVELLKKSKGFYVYRCVKKRPLLNQS